MPQHDYTPKDALRLLLEKIGRQDPDLAKRIQVAVDEGKEILQKVTEPSESGKGPKRRRRYWKIVPYSDEEAVQVALALIESHLLESRKMVNQSLDDFKKAGESPPKPIKKSETSSFVGFSPSLDEVAEPRPVVTKIGETKSLTIEAEPEQLQQKKDIPDLALISASESELNSLGALFGKLEFLMDFKGGRHGNTR